MIQVVGIGPGRREGRTIAADDALRRAEVIVGYTTYVELVRDEFAEKRFVTTGMRGEKERCVQALLLSREGRRVALICSGDAPAGKPDGPSCWAGQTFRPEPEWRTEYQKCGRIRKKCSNRAYSACQKQRSLWTAKSLPRT